MKMFIEQLEKSIWQNHNKSDIQSMGKYLIASSICTLVDIIKVMFPTLNSKWLHIASNFHFQTHGGVYSVHIVGIF